MRIGLVIDRMDPRYGGVEQWTWQFGRWLRAQQHEVHVLARTFADTIRSTGMIAHPLSCGDRLSFADAAARKPEAEAKARRGKGEEKQGSLL